LHPFDRRRILSNGEREEAMATGDTSPQAHGHRRITSVVEEARRRGLLGGETKPIGGRIELALIEEAKRVSGLSGTTELLVYALTKVAVEDDFGERLLARKGRVPKGTFGEI